MFNKYKKKLPHTSWFLLFCFKFEKSQNYLTRGEEENNYLICSGQKLI